MSNRGKFMAFDLVFIFVVILSDYFSPFALKFKAVQLERLPWPC